MANDFDVPTIVDESVIQIGDSQIRVCTLSDGQRVVDADDIEEFFGDSDPSIEDVQMLVDAIAPRH